MLKCCMDGQFLVTLPPDWLNGAKWTVIRRRRKSRNRQGLQVITLCISTTMVLILLGLVVFSVMTARNLSAYVRENLVVTLTLTDNITDAQAAALCDSLEAKSFAKMSEYISKERALEEQSEAMGSDPSEFIGFNPFTATIELRLWAPYATKDSSEWIKQELLEMPSVTEVAFQDDLMDRVNRNIGKVGLILLVLAALLTFVSFALINSTVRLSVYSKRFLIHTMKLVGASWSFIRWPFIRKALGVGIVAALLACLILGCGVYALWVYEPSILNLLTWRELAATGLSVVLFGVLITVICSSVSVNRFLRMTAGDIYKS